MTKPCAASSQSGFSALNPGKLQDHASFTFLHVVFFSVIVYSGVGALAAAHQAIGFDIANMKSMQRQFGKFTKRSDDVADVGSVLAEFKVAEETLERASIDDSQWCAKVH